MSRKIVCAVGNKYMLNCGVEVEVIARVNMKEVLVKDDEGRQRTVSVSDLLKGKIGWPNKKVKVERELKDAYDLNCGVTVEIVELLPNSRVVVSDKLGNTKETGLAQLFLGQVSWREFGVASKFKKSVKIPDVGSVIIIDGIEITIKEYVDSSNVLLEDKFGNTKRVASSEIRRDGVSWTEFIDKKNFLNPVGTYVYFVEHGDDIIYIGKGVGLRYRHTSSGRSTSYELNRLHFAGELVTTYIYEDELTDEEALNLEKEMIRLHRPRGNIANNKDF